mgnify:CR=1 FL=1
MKVNYGGEVKANKTSAFKVRQALVDNGFVAMGFHGAKKRLSFLCIS